MEGTIIPIVLIAVAALIVIIRVRSRADSSSDSIEEFHISQDIPKPSTIVPVRAPEPESREPVKLSALLPQEFVVLDLETTGLNSSADEIIEIGAIRAALDSLNHATFQTLVKPVRRIPPRITKINGISQEMVDRDGMPLEAALLQFIDFIGDLPLVTFNAEFDMGFLHNAARRHGLLIGNRYTCALKRARRAWPGLASYKLIDLARLGNLPLNDTHRALGDCGRALIVFTSATSTLGQKVRWTSPIN